VLGSDVHRAAKTRHAPGPAGLVRISGTSSGIPPPRRSCCYCHGSHQTRNACSARQSGRSRNGMSNYRMARLYGVGHRTENAVLRSRRVRDNMQSVLQSLISQQLSSNSSIVVETNSFESKSKIRLHSQDRVHMLLSP